MQMVLIKRVLNYDQIIFLDVEFIDFLMCPTCGVGWILSLIDFCCYVFLLCFTCWFLLIDV